MTLISATSESRMRSDWRFCEITASNRRFSACTSVRRFWATRSRVLCVMNHSSPPPTTTNEVPLATSSHGFLMLARRPRKSGSASLKPAPPGAAFFFFPGRRFISIMRRASAPGPPRASAAARPHPPRWTRTPSRAPSGAAPGSPVPRAPAAGSTAPRSDPEPVPPRRSCTPGPVPPQSAMPSPGTPPPAPRLPRSLRRGRPRTAPDRRDEQHAHMQPRVVRIKDLEVELHVRHVERDILIGITPDHFSRRPFLNSVHLNLLHDYVPAPNRRHYRTLIDSSRGKQPPD